MRLLCKAFGCVYGDHCSCARCGEDIYSGEFVQMGWIDPLYTLIRKWKHSRWKRHHKCKVCDRNMFWTEDSCCSELCYECWDEVPF